MYLQGYAEMSDEELPIAGLKCNQPSPHPPFRVIYIVSVTPPSEPVDFEQMILQGNAEMSEEELPIAGLEGFEEEYLINESMPMILPNAIKLHSGLWRVCVYYEENGM